MDINMVAGKKTTVTRNDVARACGVSGALVSYAFSDTAQNKVKPETREKILQTARELGYRPSLIGRCLKNHCSYNIGILLPERFTSGISLHQLRIFHGVCMAIQETDYRPMVFFGVNDKLFKSLEEHRVDGVILLDSDADLSYAENLLPYKLPMVFANVEYSCSQSYVASVRSDHEKLVNDRVNDLLAAGCRNILQISALINVCQPNYILQKSFEKFRANCSLPEVKFSIFDPGQYEVTEAMIQEAEKYFSGDSPCDGVLVDGSDFADMIQEAARRHGVILLRGKNCHLSCSQEKAFPCWSHNSFQLGKQAWDTMQKMLNRQNVEKLKLVPYFYAKSEENLTDNAICNQ